MALSHRSAVWIRGLSAMLVLAVLAIVAMSVQWRPADQFASLAAYAANKGTFTVRAPLQLSSSPQLVLEQGRIILGDDQPVTAKGRVSASRNPRKLRLVDAQITLHTDTSKQSAPAEADGAPDNMIKPLIATLGKLGFDTLEIADTDLRITSDAVASPGHKLTDIKGMLMTSRTGHLNATGSFRYRDMPVDFTAALNTRAVGKPGAGLPLVFSIKSALLESTFTGVAALANGLQLQGKIKMSAAEMRNTARWLTGSFPAGPGLKKFAAAGDCIWYNGSLSMENATLSLDGNTAAGGLSLNFSNSQPSIEGTLALKTLNLGPYLTEQGAAARAVANVIASAASITKGSSTPDLSDYKSAMPVIRHFDADVRLSADAVTLPSVQFGKAAAAISLRGGKLLADLAELELESGRGTGQITADMTGAIPRYAVRGKLESIEIDRIADAVVGRGLLAGSATVTMDLNSSGTDAGQLMRALSGKLDVQMAPGGRIGLDPLALRDAASKSDLNGWATSARQQSPVQNAAMSLVAQNGVFRATQMRATIKNMNISCAGTINLPRKHLRLQLSLGKAPIRNKAAAGAIAAPAVAPAVNVDTLDLRGSWQSPTIRLKARPRKSQAAPPPFRAADSG